MEKIVPILTRGSFAMEKIVPILIRAILPWKNIVPILTRDYFAMGKNSSYSH